MFLGLDCWLEAWTRWPCGMTVPPPQQVPCSRGHFFNEHGVLADSHTTEPSAGQSNSFFFFPSALVASLSHVVVHSSAAAKRAVVFSTVHQPQHLGCLFVFALPTALSSLPSAPHNRRMRCSKIENVQQLGPSVQCRSRIRCPPLLMLLAQRKSHGWRL